jgi:transposase
MSTSPPSDTSSSVSPSLAWDQFSHWAGFDWAYEQHDVVVLDRSGHVVAQWVVADTAEGWQDFRQRIAAYLPLAVAIETSSGVVVERLLESGVTVFPVQPKAAKGYRERQAPSGVKDNLRDAWSLADALRMDGQHWKPLRPDDPLLQELRLLTRDEVHLIGQRTALINQLQHALHEYYPTALQAFDDWTMPAAWEFVIRFPTPKALHEAGRRRWGMFLHSHGLGRPETYQRRLELFAQARQFTSSAALTNAKSRLAVALAKQLLLLEQQLRAYRRHIEELFAKHEDHQVFKSLPGIGPKLGPRLLSECGACRERFDSPQALQCYAGTAPVSFQSGQMKKVFLRRACNKYLRAAVHLWANLSRAKCAWADAYYQHKREHGMSHACALRCLGQRWLKILWKMWQTRQTYDEALHTRNQTQRGSWVLQLAPAPR